MAKNKLTGAYPAAETKGPKGFSKKMPAATKPMKAVAAKGGKKGK